jgi:hypothetical protein
MADVLKPMRISVERDQSGGVKIEFGSSIGLLTPDQAFEYAMVILKAAGVGVEFGQQFQKPAQQHFRAG